MKSATTQPPDARLDSRRQWLAALVRGAALTLLAGMSALLAMRSRRMPDGTCARGLPCRECGRWAGCTLPEAIAARDLKRRSL